MKRIRISSTHYSILRNHLFPGDNKEAVAVALCGRSIFNGSHTLLVQELLPIPYSACYERREDFVHWRTDLIIPLIEKAKEKGLAILKIHCHPGHYEKFSEIDDYSDMQLFTSIHSWMDDGLPHASCIMLPDGRIFGRFINEALEFEEVNQFTVAGSTFYNWQYSKERFVDQDLQIRTQQAFGKKTVSILNRMKIGVVGCSGTGSPTIEQLKRFGVGELVIVDPDYTDKANANRILNTTLADIKNAAPKVDVMERSITEAGFGTKITKFQRHISDSEVVKELAECDMLFGCVDGAEGRHVLNLISSFYLIPLYDLGVKLNADGNGGIEGIHGSVHYVLPAESSLLSRGQYTIEALMAESMKRANPQEYWERHRQGYLANVNESNPAVISINMQVSSTAVNDFLNRIHPFRNVTNEEVSTIRIIFGELSMFYELDIQPCTYFSKYVGLGDIDPLLNLPELSNNVSKAA